MTNDVNKYELALQNAKYEDEKFILQQFKGFYDIADEWKEKALSIVVTDASQTMDIAAAKEGQKLFAHKRRAIEDKRKELKAQPLRACQMIDGIGRELKGLIEPIEKHLKEQADFVKIKEAKEYAEFLESERIKREAKEEADRVEAARIEKERQEKLRKDNERLQAELEKERAAKAETEAKLEVELQTKSEIKKKVNNTKCPKCGHEFII